jgi:hypothetical protein
MTIEYTINWQKAEFFPFLDREVWYYVWFDSAYFQKVFWDGFWFYVDENKSEVFGYVHEIQFFAPVPEIPTPKSEIGIKKFKDCFPNVF